MLTFLIGKTKDMQTRARIPGSRSQLCSLAQSTKGPEHLVSQPRVLNRPDFGFFTVLGQGSRVRGCPKPK